MERATDCTFKTAGSIGRLLAPVPLGVLLSNALRPALHFTNSISMDCRGHHMRFMVSVWRTCSKMSHGDILGNIHQRHRCTDKIPALIPNT